jgi:hypothetical protein
MFGPFLSVIAGENGHLMSPFKEVYSHISAQLFIATNLVGWIIIREKQDAHQ